MERNGVRLSKLSVPATACLSAIFSVAILAFREIVTNQPCRFKREKPGRLLHQIESFERKLVDLAEWPRHGSCPFTQNLHLVKPEEGELPEGWHDHFYLRCFVQDPISCLWVKCASAKSQLKAREYEKAYQRDVDKGKDYNSRLWS